MKARSVQASAKTGDVLLQPGEYFVGDERHRVRTILGSCVSMTLWCSARRVGAMSHFVLASRGGSAGAALDARYGDEALTLMLGELSVRRVSPQLCEAKIFGGGDMFPDANTNGALAVGRRNGEAARRLLHGHGIKVVDESLFGCGHRQIVFDIASGGVWSQQTRPKPSRAAAGRRDG